MSCNNNMCTCNDSCSNECNCGCSCDSCSETVVTPCVNPCLPIEVVTVTPVNTGCVSYIDWDCILNTPDYIETLEDKITELELRLTNGGL